MSSRDQLDIDRKAPPFDGLRSIERLAATRSGHASVEHVRHHLYVGRSRHRSEHLLVKVTSKPGLVYERNLLNEIASLSRIARELPDAPCFPLVRDHGRLPDGRVYLTMTLFDEFPLATIIGTERMPDRLVAHLRTTIEVARALADLHGLGIFHVDLNPMNILYRSEAGRPVIRIVDFESSYEISRHAHGEFYDPPTTPGYCAPELSRQPPDARADLFSLGAVLYTMLAGFHWMVGERIETRIRAEEDLDSELRDILLTAVHENPDRRYPSMQEFHDAVAAYLEYIWPKRTW